MKFKFCALSFLLTMIFFSCKNGEKDVILQDIETNEADASRKMNNEISAIDRETIIENLQGKWKETEYPFREAHFENTTVKFIEEGVAEEPAFLKYTISKECPFEVNNIKNASEDDLFLVMAHASTCDILNVSGDTLTLSGFNVSSESDYNIIYKKVE